MSRALAWLCDDLQQREYDGLLRRRRQTRWLPDGMCDVNGHRVVNFIANDYLNLASDPRVIAAAEEALQEAGVGARASALLGGRSAWHVRLEQRLAQFEAEEAAILFPTGSAANFGTLSALIGPEDTVFCDRFNHASLVDGCRLSGAKFRVYRHDELTTLERELTKTLQRGSLTSSPIQESRRLDKRPPRFWIVTDGVFSMDGDMAPLPELCDLAERYGAEIIVDEAHATGVFGTFGRGLVEHFGVENRVAVRIGTLSKAIGTLGGFVAGSQTLIDYLWNSARTQIYSTALPSVVCAAAKEAVTILQTEPQRRIRLQENSIFLRAALKDHGVHVFPGSTGPIIPIVIQSSSRVMEIAERLEQRGFLVGAIRPPTVPHGTARLRISVSAAHAEDQLRQLATAVGDEIRRGGVPGDAHAGL